MIIKRLGRHFVWHFSLHEREELILVGIGEIPWEPTGELGNSCLKILLWLLFPYVGSQEVRMAKRYWIAWASWGEKRVTEVSELRCTWPLSRDHGQLPSAEGQTQVTAFSCFRCWLSQHRWCNTAEICSITALEASCLKSISLNWNRSLSGLRSLQGFQEWICSLSLPAAGGFPDPLAWGHLTPLSASIASSFSAWVKTPSTSLLCACI